MSGGTVEIELTCADPGHVLEEIRLLNIPVYGLSSKHEFLITFRVARKDLGRLQSLAARKGIDLRIIGRQGMYWKLRDFFSRKVLVTGIAALLALTIWLPTRVLFIRVDGNRNVPTAKILEAAENCGISFGCSRWGIRSEKLKNSLLSQIPQLQWAGINTYGTTAVITVREGETKTDPQSRSGISSIVAVREGIVTSVTVPEGTGCCAVGDAVQPGQQLISGYTDCGLTIRGTQAEGDIYALTNRQISLRTPSFQEIRAGFLGSIKKYSLLIGKKRINFYKGSGIYDAGCVKMYSKYVLTLPGGFALPVAWVREEIRTCRLTAETVEPAVAQRRMQSDSDAYLRSDMIAGNIQKREEAFETLPGCYVFSGRYLCHEMIGRSREEQIGEYHGKSDGTDRERGSGG